MKKICLLLILSIVLTGCVYESFRSLYGDEWMADHLPNQESADQSSDTGHIGATPIINISDNTNDSNGVTGDSSNDTIIPSVTTTTIRYTITFNANGGSGTMEDITMINGEERALPLCSFTAPLGKKFSCWLASDNNYASYFGNGIVVKDLMSENGAVITLSAQWLEQSQYSIFYYNTMNAANSNPTTFFESKSVTLQNLSATGYDFVGWNDAITGNRITGWAAGERTSNITLGAEWTPHKYTVIYYGNGGAGQTEKQTVSYGETFALRENGFTWDGHVFIGWCVSSTGEGTGYSAGQNVSNLTVIDGDIVELYALWEEDGNSNNKKGNIVINGEEFPFTSFVQVMSEPVTIVGSGGSSFVSQWQSVTSNELSGVFVTGRTVIISPYYIGRYNVTQKLYEMIMNIEESVDENSMMYPIVKINWYDAIIFCNKLSIVLDKQPCYLVDGINDWTTVSYEDIKNCNVNINMNANGFRLPTEAEWECAARGGNPNNITDWRYNYSGVDGSLQSIAISNPPSIGYVYYANCLKEYGWSVQAEGDSKRVYTDDGFHQLRGGVPVYYDLQPVGCKKPNTLRIYDMSGNVGEWCWDWYDGISANETVTNPIGPNNSSKDARVVRGGDSYSCPNGLQSSVGYRGYAQPSSRANRLSLRLVYSVR